MNLQYAPIDPGAEPIIFSYSLVTAFCTIITVILEKKWREKRTKTTKYLLLTFLSYLICIIITLLGFIELLLTREKREFYSFSLAFSFSGFMVSNIFLILFASELFPGRSGVPRAFIILNLSAAFFLILPWNYYGVLGEKIEGISLRPFSSGAMVAVSILTYAWILRSSYRVSRRVDDHVGKRGFQLISSSQVSLIGFFLLMVGDMLYFAISEELTGYTIFNHLAWIAAALFFMFAYLGLIMPPWLKTYLEGHHE